MPERGYHLELITPVPLPRKPTGDLARLPPRVWRAVRETRAVLDEVDADVVIGFGGYVALPAYLAARGIPGGPAPRPGGDPRSQRPRRAGQPGRRPQRRPGAVRGARIPGCGAPRWSACRSGRPSPRWTARRCGPQARAHFGFADDARVLLVFGGSQGAVSLNRAVSGGRRRPGRRRRGGAARARPQEHPRPAHARARRPALRRGAVPGPDGPGLRRRRPGDLPVRGDDGRRGVGRRPARHLRAAADRQRRAAAQRAAGGQRRRRHAGRRRRPDAATWSPSRSPGCSTTRRGWRR